MRSGCFSLLLAKRIGAVALGGTATLEGTAALGETAEDEESTKFNQLIFCNS